MVPEIALTPQIVSRFSDRFGDTVAVLHSRLTTAQRYAEWRRLREGAGADLRRPPLGRVRPRPAPRADRDRRGARGLLQARGRSPLRRPRGGRGARPARRRRAAAGQRHAAAGERPAAAGLAAGPRAWTGARCRPSRCSTCAGSRAPCTPPAVQALAEVRDARRQGDRAAQPPGLVELPLLPLLRGELGVPGMRRDARPAPRRAAARLPPLRAPRAGPRRAARTAPRAPSRATAPGPSGSPTTSPRVFDEGDFPVFRLDADAVLAGGEQAGRRRRRRDPAQLPGGSRGAC